MSLLGAIEEIKKAQQNAINTTNSASSVSANIGATNPTTTAPTTQQVANDFQSTTDIHTQVKEEEQKKKEEKQDNNSNLPVWLQINNYNDSNDEGAQSVTEEDISNALNEIVQFELSEKGKEDTIFYSDKYGQGFTNNGKVVNGSCTEGGMKKAILGGSKYITVTDASGETLSGVEAMAKSYDSVLDLYTQSQFEKVLEEYGAGTFINNCNFLKESNLKEIREKYGIDIKLVETKNADGSKAVAGIQNRTFEISLIDENGNIIEDADGNKSTILFGDWVIPDGTAQGAEVDFISIIDQAGYDCVSKADFINNEQFMNDPQFQDENGNYDAGKAYAYVISQLENEHNNLKTGKSSEIMQASEQTIDQASYTGCTFTWWSAGGGSEYYANSGLDTSLLGGVSSDLEKAFDLDNDGVLSEEEQAQMAQSVAGEKEANGAKNEENAKKVTLQGDSTQGVATGTTMATVQYTNREFYELQNVVEDSLAQNANADIEDIIRDYAESNNYNADEYVDVYYSKLKDTQVA